MKLNAGQLGFLKLNQEIRDSVGDVEIDNCYGERFIGCGATQRTITINGVPGNALGSYLEGASIVVNGNVQDAVGDTMNDGKITVYGSAGDALGYSMRGGKIYIQGDSGYRTGIHMKQYGEKCPVIMVGGRVGSFLGEYMSGGLIVVFGMGHEGVPVNYFTGAGMHGGAVFIRSPRPVVGLPPQVICTIATPEDMQSISGEIKEYANTFGFDYNELTQGVFYKLSPNANSSYKQLYTAN